MITLLSEPLLSSNGSQRTCRDFGSRHPVGRGEERQSFHVVRLEHVKCPFRKTGFTKFFSIVLMYFHRNVGKELEMELKL